MRFGVRYVNRFVESEDAHRGTPSGAAEGRLILNDVIETFVSSFAVWNCENYEQQWQYALERLRRGDSTSCFVVTINRSSNGYAIERFTVWADCDRFRIQNEIVSLKGKVNPYSQILYDSIASYRSITDDGVKISEWSLPIDTFKTLEWGLCNRLVGNSISEFLRTRCFGFVTLGTSQEDVLWLLGNPRAKEKDVWNYGSLRVVVEGGRVALLRIEFMRELAFETFPFCLQGKTPSPNSSIEQVESYLNNERIPFKRLSGQPAQGKPTELITQRGIRITFDPHTSKLSEIVTTWNGELKGTF